MRYYGIHKRLESGQMYKKDSRYIQRNDHRFHHYDQNQLQNNKNKQIQKNQKRLVMGYFNQKNPLPVYNCQMWDQQRRDPWFGFGRIDASNISQKIHKNRININTAKIQPGSLNHLLLLLLQSPHHLLQLHITNCRLPISEFSSGLKLHTLQKIDVQCNGLGAEGARLISVADLPSLVFLNMSSNSLKDEGVRFLGRLKTVRELAIGWNGITEEGIKYLKQMTQLESLSLYKNNIGPQGAHYLSMLPNLIDLNLHQNEFIGDDGAVCLRKSTKLDFLRLNGNLITDFGATKIIQRFLTKVSLNGFYRYGRMEHSVTERCRRRIGKRMEIRKKFLGDER